MVKPIKYPYIYLYIAWIIALISSAGSLYFGEMQGVEPCSLCWYQRICLFPLVVLLGWIFYDKNDSAIRYCVPFPLIGLSIAIIQILQPTRLCSSGCFSQTYQQSILPLLSAIAFFFIFFFLIFQLIVKKKTS